MLVSAAPAETPRDARARCLHEPVDTSGGMGEASAAPTGSKAKPVAVAGADAVGSMGLEAAAGALAGVLVGMLVDAATMWVCAVLLMA